MPPTLTLRHPLTFSRGRFLDSRPRIQLHLEGTKAGAAAAGSAGLLSFDQRMHHPGTGQGNSTFDYAADGQPNMAMAVAQNEATNSYQEVEPQNEKQRILLDSSTAGLDAARGGGAIGGAANQNICLPTWTAYRKRCIK